VFIRRGYKGQKKCASVGTAALLNWEKHNDIYIYIYICVCVCVCVCDLLIIKFINVSVVFIIISNIVTIRATGL
jgi:hypothetical protein